MLCPVCNKEDANNSPMLGVLPCPSCLKRRQHFTKPTPVEFTTEEIKSERIKYKDYIVQPFRDGVLSKEYVDVHGTKGIEVTPEDIKGAKNVWGS